MCRVMKRNRSKPHSFEERLTQEAFRLEAQARRLPPGKERDELFRKLRQIDSGAPG
jgi:hypothetical protein